VVEIAQVETVTEVAIEIGNEQVEFEQQAGHRS
jgi:hypothetical protein